MLLSLKQIDSRPLFRCPNVPAENKNEMLSLSAIQKLFCMASSLPSSATCWRFCLQVDPSHTQPLTSAILGIHGAVAIVTGPIIGHFADHSPSRKTPLLHSLSGCLVGTVLVACAPSLWMLFLGRILQGIAGSVVWIVGLATIVDAVGEEHMGKIMGVVNSFVTSGVISGPVVSGLLLQAVGYWSTWVAPLIVLGLDIIARLVMIENPGISKSVPLSSGAATADQPE